jgi:peptide/nickel transport system substrate-binding protein/oligopeptide transport system substrate-binding protein
MRLGTQKGTLASLLATAGMLALLLAACGGSSPPTQSGPRDRGANQKLIINWGTGGGSADIVSYDAAQAQDSGSIPIANMLYDPLVTLDQNLKVEDWAADNITTSADGLTYTFHIRAGQEFSDGTPVKASDFAFSLNRVINPCEASPVGYYLPQGNLKDANAFNTETCGKDGKTIEGSIQTLIGDSIIADDSAGTLTMKLTQPAGFFLDAVSYVANGVVEQSALGDGLGASGAWTDNLSKPEGNSGMFEVKSNDKQGHLKLVPNPHWWGIAAGKKLTFTEVDFNMYESSDTSLSTYQSDPSVAMDQGTLPAQQVAGLKADPNSGYQETPFLLVQGFSLNYKIPPFDNKDARLAFSDVINRTQVANNVLNGVAIPTWHIVPKGMPGYNPNLTGPDGAGLDNNLTLAQNHWNAYKATLNGRPVPPIKISFNLSSSTAKALAEFYQATFDQAFGINVTLDQTAWKTILKEEQQKTVQIFRFGWIADYPDPQDFLTLLFSTGSGYNAQNASVPAADQLMQQADGIFQPEQQQQRLSLYNQAEQLLINDGAFVPVYTAPNTYTLRSWVKGMTEDAQAQFPNDAWVTGYLTKSEPNY